jgi:D-cysteine desulfhydrase
MYSLPIPLVRRFPALAAIPRVVLGRFPTPLERADALAPAFWVKRDDLTATPLGGNKVRALEFLLGGLRAREVVVTVGALGSTHVLATALYASRLGGRPVAFRWPQVMNAVARMVAQRIEEVAPDGRIVAWIGEAYARAFGARIKGARWVPAGGSAPLGVLGHVNAALELADQIAAGGMPVPARIVVPLGSGGTAAGLLLGTRIAGLPVQVVGARVVPRLVANAWHVRRLAHATARLIERITGERMPHTMSATERGFHVVHNVYGGGYGRDTDAADRAVARFREWSGTELDTTYGGKALGAALALAGGGPTVFWLTFDGRWLAHNGGWDAGRAPSAAGTGENGDGAGRSPATSGP